MHRAPFAVLVTKIVQLITSHREARTKRSLYVRIFDPWSLIFLDRLYLKHSAQSILILAAKKIGTYTQGDLYAERQRAWFSME